ncbi:uncharacterized protein PITG_21040 [Phytophthora infestans T30-4]|uniref:DOT1 domain-containing protein n=1 Tax=Phytophthora infestans (strain T30-4) TaxID=403677 RepID=D0P3G8_PHYIT|nr:uncharacterized protein PITG_21040 [Phytophthora infestans T30-4]EEY59754.1 conserved hypothetical protein [Phytophthora infestans T30-4]|eukprot:XP_002895156.1 conserved hypothetical protein [Phytophthora infestans T30-4]
MPSATGDSGEKRFRCWVLGAVEIIWTQLKLPKPVDIIFGSISAHDVRQPAGRTYDNAGEVLPSGVTLLLAAVGPLGEADVFLDVGAGVGNVLAQVALTKKVRTCIGIEVRRDLVSLGRRCMQQLRKQYPRLSKVLLKQVDSACGSSNLARCSIITSECSSSPYVMRVTTDSVSTAGLMSVAVTDCTTRTAKSAGAITKVTKATCAADTSCTSGTTKSEHPVSKSARVVTAKSALVVYGKSGSSAAAIKFVCVFAACENGTTATSAGFTTTFTSASDFANIRTGTTKSASQHTFRPIIQTAVAVWSRRNKSSRKIATAKRNQPWRSITANLESSKTLCSIIAFVVKCVSEGTSEICPSSTDTSMAWRGGRAQLGTNRHHA